MGKLPLNIDLIQIYDFCFDFKITYKTRYQKIKTKCKKIINTYNNVVRIFVREFDIRPNIYTWIFVSKIRQSIVKYSQNINFCFYGVFVKDLYLKISFFYLLEKYKSFLSDIDLLS